MITDDRIHAESDEEDEDYVPPTHESDDDEIVTDEKISMNNTVVNTLSAAKQKSVDDAFAELFGSSSSKGTQLSGHSGISSSIKSPKSKKALKKRKLIFSEIFGGSSIASKLIKTSSNIFESERNRKRDIPLPKIEKIEVKETKIFAGQAIEVSKSVLSSKETTINATVATQQTKGIDAVLSQISGPQKITTVDKTSMDWDSFKDKTGIDEELRKKVEGKDAYLVKQEFLQRVDYRKFEQEKAQRERDRISTNESSIKK